MDSESHLISHHWTAKPGSPLKRAGWLYEFLSFGHGTHLQLQMARTLDTPSLMANFIFSCTRICV